MQIYLRGHESVCVSERPCLHLDGNLELCVLLRGSVGGEDAFCIWIQFRSNIVPLTPVYRALQCLWWLGFDQLRVCVKGSPALGTLGVTKGASVSVHLAS